MPREAKMVAEVASTTAVEPPVRILDLVDAYATGLRVEGTEHINETTLRETFLNPVLEELGWDPRNRRGVTPRDRDVILEDRLSIDGKQKAPDYALVWGGRRKVFVEAKRPSISIGRSNSASHQIRRYCWSAGLPLGLLTNFEEFAIYDCRSVPQLTDSASEDRILYFKYGELADHWGDLVSLFGKKQVAAGSIEAYAKENKAPRQSKPIDEAFLAEIRQWRITLAVDIAKRNSSLDVFDLNQVVQKLIDRLIFLRIAEARGLEPMDALVEAVNSDGDYYKNLIEIFQRADDRYNSGLFHLSPKEEVSGPPDVFSIDLNVSDAPLRRVISRMYYPQPYEFSVMPADILGRIYEQFLGERIELDGNGLVCIEMKADLRKSGGVYYTPTPIVDYMVEKSIGPLLKGKGPKEVEKMRIVDPACGSGSFLIAVYQYLLDWHRDYYADKVRLAKANLEVGTDGSLRLKAKFRRQILVNNIYGVDIDPQAVEVTKLSLLLKLIEGQTQMEFSVGRILPELERNIACGNALIGTDMQIPSDINKEDRLKYNPFDWIDMWPDIFKNGGFDAVLGNPPYLNIDKIWGARDARTAYIKAAYSDIYSDKTDILFYFLRRSADISKSEVAFIVSRSFLEADKARRLRGWLGENMRAREILDFQHARVFPKVGINTAVVRFTKSRAVKETTFRRWVGRSLPISYDERTLGDLSLTNNVTVPHDELTSNVWNFGDTAVRELNKRMDDRGDRLGDILHIGQGMQTAANNVFEFDLDKATYEELHAAGFIYRRAKNSNIRKYGFRGEASAVLFPNRVNNFVDLPPIAREQLERNEEKLKSRAAYIRGDCEWWQYSWPLHSEFIDAPRIFCPYMAVESRFAVDQDCAFIGWTDTTVLFSKGQPEDLRYIAAILNSDCLTFRFRFLAKLREAGKWEYFENSLSELPIPRASPGDFAHDELVGLVTQREEAWAELSTTHLADDRDVVLAVVKTIDRKIDDAVARLFDLGEADATIIQTALTAGW